jgi:biotin carboxyl carrier protein
MISQYLNGFFAQCVQVESIQGGPGRYLLRLNKSEIHAETHTLRDGGLLVQLDGNSHVVYAEEEAAGTRLLIDGRTCLLQSDHDPSRLIAETPCKLMRFLVTDGSHVDTDVPYAEVEVMKMCMPLLSPASGTIHFRMPEGSAMMVRGLSQIHSHLVPSSCFVYLQHIRRKKLYSTSKINICTNGTDVWLW